VVVETLKRRGLRLEEQMGEAGGVEIRQQEELTGRPVVGDQQNRVEVVDTDDLEDKEATEALPATHPAACWG
jgi:hypothetical protein